MTGNPPVPVSGLSAATLEDDYRRRRLGDRPVDALVAAVSEVLAVPRSGPAQARGMLGPADLLARATLFRFVDGPIPEEARLQVVALAVAHEAAGPPVPEPDRVSFSDPSVAGRELASALDLADVAQADRCAAWLEERLPLANIGNGVAGVTVGRTAANGSSSLYAQLLRRADGVAPMLRTVARAVAGDRRHHVGAELAGPIDDPDLGVLAAFAGLPFVGPPAIDDIAGTIDRAQTLLPEPLHALTRAVRRGRALGERDLLRLAAAQLVADPSRAERYLDALVTTNATIDAAAALGRWERERAIHVAVVWAAAAWTTHGPGTAAGVVDIVDRLDTDGGADHDPAHDAARWDALVRRAICNPDGRLARYVLACRQASVVDQAAAVLFLDAGEALAAAVESGALERRTPVDGVIDLT